MRRLPARSPRLGRQAPPRPARAPEPRAPGRGRGGGGGGAAGGLNPSDPCPRRPPGRGTCWPRARRGNAARLRPPRAWLPVPSGAPGSGRPGRSSQPGGSALCFPNFGHLLAAERPRRPGDRRCGEKSGRLVRRPGWPSASPTAQPVPTPPPQNRLSVQSDCPTGAWTLGSLGLDGVTSADPVRPLSSLPVFGFSPLILPPPPYLPLSAGGEGAPLPALSGHGWGP